VCEGDSWKRGYVCVFVCVFVCVYVCVCVCEGMSCV